MFNENDLRELSEFKAENAVLSIYLNTEPSHGTVDAHKLRLKNMLKSIDLPRDKEVVEKFFDLEYDWLGQGIAVFSCQEKDFFRTWSLAVPVKDWVHKGSHLSIKPLANLLENYGNYGVVLVDKQGARVFSFHLGKISEQEGFMGEEIKQLKRGSGGSTIRGRKGGFDQSRGLDEMVERNMKDVAQFAMDFFDTHNIQRVLISGTEGNIALFQNLLSKAWQKRVVGTLNMSINANQHEVLQKAVEIGRHVEKEHEGELINSLITSAAKDQGAVIGIENTLRAVNQGRVQTLVVPNDLHLKGYRCEGCGYLIYKDEEACKNCGGSLNEINDVIESAVGGVLRAGGDVEIVSANEELKENGTIGAFLRY